MSGRRAVYAVAWEPASSRRCVVCDRWVSEGQVAGFDLRRRLRWCQGCVDAREARLAALRAWAGVAALRTTTVSGAV